jgi:hypothetical protein
MKTLAAFIDWIQRLGKKPDPNDLNMGEIGRYAIFVPQEEVAAWIEKGWKEDPAFPVLFGRSLPEGIVAVFGKPKTILEVGTDEIIGRYITDYSPYYGSYGMGGPGFLGFTLSEKPEVEASSFVLVYAVGRAAEWTLLDNRIVECNPIYYDTFHPWISDYGDKDIPNWDDLHAVIVGSVITSVHLKADRCSIKLNKLGVEHTLEFVKNDSRLAPFGNGQPREDAFTSGTIGDCFVLQAPNGMLYTR